VSAALASMTGFGAGRAEAELESGRYSCDVEARSVNGRHLKLNVRVPDELSSLVPRIEALARGAVSRGTVYLTLRLTDAGGIAGRLDEDALQTLYRKLQELGEGSDAAPRLDVLCLAPGVFRDASGNVDADALWPTVEQASSLALEELVAMRATEGAGLAADLRGIASDLRDEANAIEAAAPDAVAALAARLRARVAELMGDAELSPSDLAREVALLADKADISEELQRLRSHLDQVESALDKGGPSGRRLEFLAQELGREANTLTNKCRDDALIQRALELKLGVERFKEQVANLE
jgi:uncharacterized protein (TIGR00255 family)